MNQDSNSFIRLLVLFFCLWVGISPLVALEKGDYAPFDSVYHITSQSDQLDFLFAPARWYLRDEMCSFDDESGFGESRFHSLVEAPDWEAMDFREWRDDHRSCHWFKIKFVIDEPYIDRFFLNIGYNSDNEIYLFRDGELIGTYSAGNNLPLAQRSSQLLWPHTYRNTIELHHDRTLGSSAEKQPVYELVTRIRNNNGANIYGKGAEPGIHFYDEAYVEEYSHWHVVISYFLVGGFCLMLVYHLFQWLTYRDNMYGAYCLLLLTLLAYISFENFVLHDLFRNSWIGEYWLILPAAFAHTTIFYFTANVVRQVGGSKAMLNVLYGMAIYKGIEGLVWCGAYAMSVAGWDVFTPMLVWLPDVFRITTLVSLLTYLLLVVRIAFKHRGWPIRMLILGNALLSMSVMVYVLWAVLHPYAHIKIIWLYLVWTGSFLNYLVEIGMVCLVLCFAIAIALLTKEKERKLTRDFTQQVAETEMSALRSQMNPHFLFNGLNSIKLFVIRNQPKEAAEYLSKFARLIRLILENSKSSLIPLEKELEALGFYMEMESLRFEDRFTYSIEIDEDVEVDLLEVPPMLLQPYIENAIWHGLLHRDIPGGEVRLHIKNGKKDRIEVTIEDNGIGRVAAQEMKSRSATNHKSLGMQITADRLQNLEETYGIKTIIEITDLGTASLPTGTRVVITLGQPQRGTHRTTKSSPNLLPV
ncbi:MAG: sensor histidine kinase [Saprospiraceae bacterium]